MGTKKAKPPRSGKNTKGEQLYRCPFPDCGSLFAPEPGQPAACIRHRRFVEDVMYVVNHIKWATPDGTPSPAEDSGPPQEEPGPSIYVPKPGQADRAIEEARRASQPPATPH